MIRNHRALLACATTLLLSGPSFGQSPPNERDDQPPTGPMVTVENIEFLGLQGGENNVDVTGFNFFPVGTTGAHLDLATGHIQELVGDPTTPDGLWWDIEFKVTASPNDTDPSGRPLQPVMLAIDKDVRNMTRFHWTDFHMTLGMKDPATGEFMESDEFDFLYFKDDPAAKETTGYFDDPPMKDEPVAPDNLWWMGGTGVKPGEVAVFWLGIQIPPHKFGPDGMATFVLREHASIPEPATWGLMAVAGGLAIAARRRSRR